MSHIPKPVSRETVLTRLHTNLKYYSQNCLKIRDKQGNITPLVFNKAQDYLHEQLEQQRKELGFVRAIIMKGRQEGVSTYVAARFFHRTSMNRGTTSFILSHETKSTGNLFDMVKRFEENLPSGMSPGLDTSNKNQLKFAELDSEYTVGTAGNDSVGRSMTIKFLHMSEAAFYPSTDGLETGLMQAVADMPGTEIIIESTANGLGNFFHERAMKAMANIGLFRLIFIPWYWQSEYRLAVPNGFAPDESEVKLMQTYQLDLEQIYWRRMKIAQTKGGLWKFQQEYPFTPDEAFLMSGETYYSKDSVVRARRNSVKSPEDPIILGIDAGRNNDRSVFVIRQGRAVLHYEVHKDLRAEGREPTQQLIAIAANLINRHHVDKCFIDCGYGHGLIDGLISLGFRGIVVGVNFQQTPLDKIRFLNKRAEMHGLARDWLDDGDVNIPDDDIFCFDLMLIPKEKETPTKREFIPSKDEIRAKSKVSPDINDAFILTFAFPVVRRLRENELPLRRRNPRRVLESPLSTLNRFKQKA